MRYKLFGRSGLRVSEASLGTLMFGSGTVSAQDARAIFDVYAEAGGNFIDTAHGYQDGRSEAIVGELVKSDRDHFVVSTKYGVTTGKGSISKSGSSRKNMRRCVEESLRRLGTDAIDLLYLHIWDFTTQWDEILSGLDALVRSGKVHYIAISDTPAWEISRAVTMSELRGWTSFVGVQLMYSLAERTPERELLPMARELDLGVTAWSPLGGGVLTGRYSPDAAVTDRGTPIPPTAKRAGSLVTEVARELECPPGQVALAWIRTWGQKFGAIFPVVGADTPDQLAENLGYLKLSLDDQQLRRLDDATRVDLGFPYDKLLGGQFRALTTAQNAGLLDNHRYQDARAEQAP